MSNYKTVPGFPEYGVTIDGKVKRLIGGRKTEDLKQSFHAVRGKSYPNGYMYVTLVTKEVDVNGVKMVLPCYQGISVHRLVALTWLPIEDSSNMWVNHKDGNKLNNHADNLEWTTISQNIQHAVDTGLRVMPKGKSHWRYGCKLSEETKLKQAKAKVGKLHPKYKGYYVIHGQRYYSAIEAAKSLKISAKTVINRTKSGKWDNYLFFEDLKS